MHVTDIAVERQYQTITALRQVARLGRVKAQVSWEGLADLVRDAVPCYWSPSALQHNFGMADSYPLDAHTLRHDLLAPLQWWYLDKPRHEDNSPEALLVCDGAHYVPEAHGNRLLVVLFLKTAHPAEWGSHPIAMASWDFDTPFTTTFRCWPVIANRGVLDSEDTLSMMQGLMRVVASGICWLRSTVAAVARMPLGRGTRRRLSLSADEAHGPHVITLRASEATAAVSALGAESMRELSCRFLVSAHWRNQFLPSTGEHRPTLISPYIKGPKDAPFRARTDVRYKIDR